MISRKAFPVRCLVVSALVLAAVIGVNATAVCAAEYDYGLGIIVGEPTGLSAKKWLAGKTAIDAAVAWALSNDTALHLHADFLVHRFDLAAVESGSLALYYGIGARLLLVDDEKLLGARTPFGLDYLLGETRIEVFFEIVPVLNLLPDSELDLNAGFGGRYFF